MALVHMESTWNVVQSTWIQHGMEFSPHGFHMEWSSVHMDSTWNGVQSKWIPHGMGFIPRGFHMDWGGFHIHSIWNAFSFHLCHTYLLYGRLLMGCLLYFTMK